MGRCPDCGEWNTMVETIAEPDEPTSRPPSVLRSQPRRITEINAEGLERFPLPMKEFARVLGGGVVPGSLILVGGDPGIGKSTLLLQASALMAQATRGPVLYVSGEESAQQIRMRADRLQIKNDDLYVVTETDLDAIVHHAQGVGPEVMVVDSIQTVTSEDLSSAAGSISQVRCAASRFREWAKTSGVAVFLVGHVTKEGAIAGPKTLEHIVDTVLYLEGERFHAYRLLRSVKNRFGATSEVGVFEMREQGLVEVPNPSEVFLAERMVNAPGSAIAVTMEGTRPLMVEIQALASHTTFGHPRRTANGVDYNRLLLITAVLTRRVGLRLFEQDVFASVVGGLQVGEPAADLAVAVAIASSVRDRPVMADLTVLGEVGLSGEVRTVSHTSSRLKEAARLGFKRCLLPRTVRRGDQTPTDGIEAIPVRSVAEAIQKALM
jgi:DNA repair protein RadA/Sms